MPFSQIGGAFAIWEPADQPLGAGVKVGTPLGFLFQTSIDEATNDLGHRKPALLGQ